MSGTPRFKTIIPPHLIAARVTGSGGADPEALKRAESSLAELTEAFERSAHEQVGRLQRLHAQLAAGAGADGLAEIFQLAHELKGQSGTFGYALLSQIGDLLCRYVEHGDTGSARSADVLKALIDAMAAILARKVRGEGDALGRQILLELQHLTGRLGG
jgi:chemotaxis protein histidine kinase CheA